MRDTTTDLVATTTTTALTATRQTEVFIDSSKSIWSLVYYTLSVIVVCLTGFNFYLFCWIWSSLSFTGNGSGGDDSGFMMRSTQWAPIDTISSWNGIRFNGKLASLQELQVGQVLAANDGGRLLIASKNSVQVVHHKKPLIELVAKRRRIQLPTGLRVDAVSKTGNDSSAQADNRKQGARLSCDPVTAHCLASASTIVLSHKFGVDFNRKSVQTPKVSTKRVHSPTNWLNLYSSNFGLFESKSGSIHLIALDELSLFSRNAAVSDDV